MWIVLAAGGGGGGGGGDWRPTIVNIHSEKSRPLTLRGTDGQFVFLGDAVH